MRTTPISTTFTRSERPMMETLESRLLRAGAPLTVSVPAGKSVVFVGPGGTLYNVQFTQCGGDVTFAGDSLEQSTLMNGVLNVKGDVTGIDDIAITSKTGDKPGVILHGNAAALKNPNLVLGGFVAPAAVVGLIGLKLKFNGMSLQGNLNAPVARLDLGSSTGSTMQFAASNQPVTFNCGTVTDTQITSAAPIQLFNTGSFISTAPGNSFLNGTFADSLKIDGSTSANFNVSGGRLITVKSAMVHNDIIGGSWRVNGDLEYMSAVNYGSTFTGQVTGNMDTFKSWGNFNGFMQAGSIKAIDVWGSMSNSSFQLTNPFDARGFNASTINVRGAFTNSLIQSDGNLGRLEIGVSFGSDIFAGVSNNFNFAQMPTSADIVSPTRITSFHEWSAATNAFQSTNIAAGTIGSADVQHFNPQNNGIPYGLTANDFGTIKFRIGKDDFRLNDIRSQADLTRREQSAHLSPLLLGDFNIRASF